MTLSDVSVSEHSSHPGAKNGVPACPEFFANDIYGGIHMDRYYLIGTPIAHSLSPSIMNTAFHRLSLDAHYDLMETDEGSLAETVSRLKAEGACGWNVTMPVKQGMCRLCDELSVASLISGAVNTVKQHEGKLTGYTTDGIGLIRALADQGIAVKGSRLTLLGTGGAATAILVQAALDGADEIAVFANRPSSRAKIEEVRTKLGEHSGTRIRICGYDHPDELRGGIRDSGVLINATNVGMAGTGNSGGCLIPDSSFLPEGLFVYDVIYHPAETPLMKMARQAGCRTENGFSMLLGQAAASFEIWTGREMPLIADELSFPDVR